MITKITTLQEAQTMVRHVLESDPDRTNPVGTNEEFETPGCLYVAPDGSNCVVGAVYRLCGATNEELQNLEDSAASVLGRILGIVAVETTGFAPTPAANQVARFLDNIQRLADEGFSWGVVLKEAEKRDLL